MKIVLEEEERADAEAKEGEGDMEVLQIPKMTQMMKIITLGKSKITCYNFQKLGHYPNKCKLPNKNKLKKDKEKANLVEEERNKMTLVMVVEETIEKFCFKILLSLNFKSNCGILIQVLSAM